jgi:FkbM family methyltransferase
MTPPLLASVYEALTFGRDHRLSGGWGDWVMAHRGLHHFGLHYLPPNLSLDGLIVDVGANEGKFTATVRLLEPRARVIAIEPSPDPLAILTARFAGDPQVTVDGRAVSDHVGSAAFNVTQWSVYDSLLTPNETIAVDSQEIVALTTLDQIVDGPVRVLKIDVQGAEVAVLRGATRTLAVTDAVILEVLFTSHYEGDALFGELDGLMREAGFVLTGLTEAERKGGRAMWADACYVRP